MKTHLTIATVLVLLVLAALAPAARAATSTVGDCHVGAYRLASGEAIDIAPTDSDALRWRRFDGTTGTLREGPDGTWAGDRGWTDHTDPTRVTFAPCSVGTLTFDGAAGRRISFDITNATFEDRGVKLAGRLVMPKGAGRAPVVVLIHGSENDSALTFYFLQRMLPAQGIGVFVYDKRGTGASGGKYTQDFDLLADDAVAAMREARKLAGPRAGRVGYQGGSEGGWVAPLAASRAPVDFVVVSFGLAVSPIEEDREEIELEMSLAGHGPADIAKALEVGEAAEALMKTRTPEAYRRFDAVRAKYRGEAWYKDLRGNLTRLFLPYEEGQLRALAAKYDWGTPLDYDSMPVLRKLAAPQLWLLGKEDLDAPSAETARRLNALAAEGRPITLAVFPGAEHGLTLFEIGPDGQRVSTRYAPGYFPMMADFIKRGRLRPAYGDAVISVHGPQAPASR